MKSYLAIVEKDQGSALGVSFPDIPGCFSAADEQETVMANAIEALQLWAEDMPMPEPAPHHQIGPGDCRAGMAGQLHGVGIAIGDHAALGGAEEPRQRITQRDRGCFGEKAGKLHRALLGMIHGITSSGDRSGVPQQ